jgi:hypothetical protein
MACAAEEVAAARTTDTRSLLLLLLLLLASVPAVRAPSVQVSPPPPTPTFDRQHPDQAPVPHSNSEWAGEHHILSERPWLRGLLKKGAHALMWDGKDPSASADPARECVWTQYRCQQDGVNTCQDGVNSLPMCVHATDVVSNAIITNGKWDDCNYLSSLWRWQQHAFHMDGFPIASTGSVYLEVGANIGACVAHMLLHTDANIVAFEPGEQNLFCLTRSLLKMGEQFRRCAVAMAVA